VARVHEGQHGATHTVGRPGRRRIDPHQRHAKQERQLFSPVLSE
jgi:hypothetical protein